jgi:hypothetical protein
MTETFMQRAFILLIVGSFLLAGVAGACDFSQRGTSQVCTISVNGVTRQYMLWLYLHGAHGGM